MTMTDWNTRLPRGERSVTGGVRDMGSQVGRFNWRDSIAAGAEVWVVFGLLVVASNLMAPGTGWGVWIALCAAVYVAAAVQRALVYWVASTEPSVMREWARAEIGLLFIWLVASPWAWFARGLSWLEILGYFTLGAVVCGGLAGLSWRRRT